MRVRVKTIDGALLFDMSPLAILAALCYSGASIPRAWLEPGTKLQLQAELENGFGIAEVVEVPPPPCDCLEVEVTL